MDKKNEKSSRSGEINEISAMRNNLVRLCEKYITTFNKFPLVRVEGVTDINEIIDRNVNFEIETRKLQKKLGRYLTTINKLLDAGINASVLHQHFLGCINIAMQCNDFLCMKIFLSQAHSTFTEIIRYIRLYLNLSKDIEKFEDDITPSLQFIRPSIEFSEQFLKLDENLLTDIEKFIDSLADKIET